MKVRSEGMPGGKGSLLLCFLFFFIQKDFLPFFLFFLFLGFFGDHVEVNRVSLHHLEFDLALRATQDFAFFDFIFVHVDFGGAIGTANHGISSSQSGRTRTGWAYYIPPVSSLDRKSTRLN